MEQEEIPVQLLSIQNCCLSLFFVIMDEQPNFPNFGDRGEESSSMTSLTCLSAGSQVFADDINYLEPLKVSKSLDTVSITSMMGSISSFEENGTSFQYLNPLLTDIAAQDDPMWNVTHLSTSDLIPQDVPNAMDTQDNDLGEQTAIEYSATGATRSFKDTSPFELLNIHDTSLSGKFIPWKDMDSNLLDDDHHKLREGIPIPLPKQDLCVKELGCSVDGQSHSSNNCRVKGHKEKTSSRVHRTKHSSIENKTSPSQSPQHSGNFHHLVDYLKRFSTGTKTVPDEKEKHAEDHQVRRKSGIKLPKSLEPKARDRSHSECGQSDISCQDVYNIYDDILKEGKRCC